MPLHYSLALRDTWQHEAFTPDVVHERINRKSHKTLHAMQLRVDVSADGKVLATLADNELQVIRLPEYISMTPKHPLPKILELALCTVNHAIAQHDQMLCIGHALITLRHRALQRLQCNTHRLCVCRGCQSHSSSGLQDGPSTLRCAHHRSISVEKAFMSVQQKSHASQLSGSCASALADAHLEILSWVFAA